MCVAILLRCAILGVAIVKVGRAEKRSPFECGFLRYEERRGPFSVHFFLVGLIFLVFDTELILIFPYLRGSLEGGQASLSLALLLAVLRGGLFLEWEKGLLN